MTADQQAACSECGHSGGVETDMGYSCPTCSTADQQPVCIHCNGIGEIRLEGVAYPCGGCRVCNPTYAEDHST
jgi:hypothetical protein